MFTGHPNWTPVLAIVWLAAIDWFVCVPETGICISRPLKEWERKCRFEWLEWTKNPHSGLSNGQCILEFEGSLLLERAITRNSVHANCLWSSCDSSVRFLQWGTVAYQTTREVCVEKSEQKKPLKSIFSLLHNGKNFVMNCSSYEHNSRTLSSWGGLFTLFTALQVATP